MNLIAYYPWVYLKGGAERLLLEMVTRSRHDWTIYTNRYDPKNTFPEFADLPLVELDRVDSRRDIAHVAAAGLTIALQRINCAGQDAALVLSEGLGNLMAGHFSVPTACLCLTPLRVAYEDVAREQFFGGRQRPAYRTALAGFRAVDRWTWRRYAEVICISDEVRGRVLQHRLVSDDEMSVVRPGVDLVRFHPGGERRPVFLITGRIMWQKRIEDGLEAWRRFKPHPDDSPFRLVVAGMVDEKSRPYLSSLQRAVAWRHDVEFVASPTDAAMVDLYRTCRAVLFTAPNEDFGLVPLEAMACGKPVIASARGGPTETVIDGATGLLVDGAGSFAAAIAAIAGLDDGRLDEMGMKARSRAEEFSWDDFVHALDARMEHVAGRVPERISS
jgi:glycosyltransferase involved in cell wall biosynthesis